MVDRSRYRTLRYSGCWPKTRFILTIHTKKQSGETVYWIVQIVRNTNKPDKTVVQKGTLKWFQGLLKKIKK